LPVSACLPHLWRFCPPGLKVAPTDATMYVINPSLSIPFHHTSHSSVPFTLCSSSRFRLCRSPPSATVLSIPSPSHSPDNVAPSFARWSACSLPRVLICAFTYPGEPHCVEHQHGLPLPNHLQRLLQLRCPGSTSPSCLSHGCYWPDSS